MLLAIETSTKVCSVAFRDNEGEITEKRVEKRGSHSEKLFLFIEELMQEKHFAISDLDAVLVSQGPGSYTGLRIAASAVKGLLFQSEVPLLAADTLAGFAQAAIDKESGAGSIHAVIDARRVHLYHQHFEQAGKGLKSLSEVEILPIEKVQQMMESGDMFIGTGIDRLESSFLEGVSSLGPENITAQSLISLYDLEQTPFLKQVDPESFDPKYYTSRQVEK